MQAITGTYVLHEHTFVVKGGDRFSVETANLGLRCVLVEPPRRGLWGRFKLWMQMTYDFPPMAKGSAVYSPKPKRWYYSGRSKVRRQ
jgi:hypothetical protein